jgi:hypothetical protein
MDRVEDLADGQTVVKPVFNYHHSHHVFLKDFDGNEENLYCWRSVSLFLILMKKSCNAKLCQKK